MLRRRLFWGAATRVASHSANTNSSAIAGDVDHAHHGDTQQEQLPTSSTLGNGHHMLLPLATLLHSTTTSSSQEVVGSSCQRRNYATAPSSGSGASDPPTKKPSPPTTATPAATAKKSSGGDPEAKAKKLKEGAVLLARRAKVPASKATTIHPKCIFVVAKRNNPKGKTDLFAVLQLTNGKSVAFGTKAAIRKTMAAALRNSAPKVRPIVIAAAHHSLEEFVEGEVSFLQSGGMGNDKHLCASVFASPPLDQVTKEVLADPTSIRFLSSTSVQLSSLPYEGLLQRLATMNPTEWREHQLCAEAPTDGSIMRQFSGTKTANPKAGATTNSPAQRLIRKQQRLHPPTSKEGEQEGPKKFRFSTKNVDNNGIDVDANKKAPAKTSAGALQYLNTLYSSESRVAREEASRDELLQAGNLVVFCASSGDKLSYASGDQLSWYVGLKGGSSAVAAAAPSSSSSSTSSSASSPKQYDTIASIADAIEAWEGQNSSKLKDSSDSAPKVVIVASDLKQALWFAKEVSTARDDIDEEKNKKNRDAIRSLVAADRLRVWCLSYGHYLLNAQNTSSAADQYHPTNPTTTATADASKDNNIIITNATPLLSKVRGAFLAQVRRATTCSMITSVSKRMLSLLATFDMECNALAVCNRRELQDLKQAILRQSLAAKEELEEILRSEQGGSGTSGISPLAIHNWSWAITKNIATILFGGSLQHLLVSTARVPLSHPSCIAEIDRFSTTLRGLQNKLARDQVMLSLRAVFLAAVQIGTDGDDAQKAMKDRDAFVLRAVGGNWRYSQELGPTTTENSTVPVVGSSSPFTSLFNWLAQQQQSPSNQQPAQQQEQELSDATVEAMRCAVLDSFVVVEARATFTYADGEFIATKLSLSDSEYRTAKTKSRASLFGKNGRDLKSVPDVFSCDITHDGPNMSEGDRPWPAAVGALVGKLLEKDLLLQPSIITASAAASKSAPLFALPKVLLIAANDTTDKMRNFCFSELFVKEWELQNRCTAAHGMMPSQRPPPAVCVVSNAALRKPSGSMFEDLDFAMHSNREGSAPSLLRFNEGADEKQAVLAMLGERVGLKTNAFAVDESASATHSSSSAAEKYRPKGSPPLSSGAAGSGGHSNTRSFPQDLATKYSHFHSGVSGVISGSLLSAQEINALRARCAENSATHTIQVNEKSLQAIADAAEDAMAKKAEANKNNNNDDNANNSSSGDKHHQQRVAKTEKMQTIRTLLQAYRSREKDLVTVGVKNTGNFEIINDRVHHSLHHNTTATGRLSSRNPNAQSIPKTIVRRMFRSRFGRENGSILEADFSQLEVVVLACLSKDQQMLKDLSNKVDFHCKRVAMMKSPKFSYDEVIQKTKVEKDPQFVRWRQQAKVFSFQRQYGAGAKQIAESTGLDMATVNALMVSEDATYSGVSKYYDRAYEIVLHGHKFKTKVKNSSENDNDSSSASSSSSSVLEPSMFPILSGTKFNLTSAANGGGRKAPILLNYPVQGFAGEIVLLVLSKLHQHFATTNNYNSRAVLINTVHDCVWVDCENDVIDEVKRDVRRIMESVPQLVMELWPEMGIADVRFPVSISAGPTLYDQKDLD